MKQKPGVYHTTNSIITGFFNSRMRGRLHVNIFDTAKTQFTVPESVVSRPPPPQSSHKGSSDLVFNHNAKPFAFWITRRSAPHATPLFDTRIASLPPTPIPAKNPTLDNSTALNSFALVFEDQYLQVRDKSESEWSYMRRARAFCFVCFVPEVENFCVIVGVCASQRGECLWLGRSGC